MAADIIQGKDLLAELLVLARRQSEALTADDMARFDLLANRRERLVRTMKSADWSDHEGAVRVARDLQACDEVNKAILRQRAAAVAQELAEVRKAAGALHCYRGLAQMHRREPRFVDRSV